MKLKSTGGPSARAFFLCICRLYWIAGRASAAAAAPTALYPKKRAI